MLTRYYQPPAWQSGLSDFLVNFAATRKAKEEIESGLKAQASAQRNQAWAGAAGDVAGGLIGGLTAGSDAFGNLNPAEQLSLATSFIPRGQNVSRTAGGIGAQQADATNRMDFMASRDYLERFGSMPPVDLAGLRAATGGGAPSGGLVAGTGESETFGGAPMPTFNPASTQDYRKAQQTIAAYDNYMRRPMSPQERQMVESQIGPEVQRARQVLERAQPPAPPSSIQEYIQQFGGFELPNGGGFFMPKGPGQPWTHIQPSRVKDGAPWESEPDPAKREMMKQQDFASKTHMGPDGVLNYLQPDGSWKPVEKKPNPLLPKVIDAYHKQLELTGEEPTAAGYARAIANLEGAEGVRKFIEQERAAVPQVVDELHQIAMSGHAPPEQLYAAGQETLRRALDAFGEESKVPVEIRQKMAEVLQVIQRQQQQQQAVQQGEGPPVDLPSEKEITAAERKEYRRLGIKTQEQVSKEQAKERRERDRQAKEQEAKARLWENAATYNLSGNDDIIAINPNGKPTKMSREGVSQEAFMNAMARLMLQGFRFPGLEPDDPLVPPSPNRWPMAGE